MFDSIRKHNKILQFVLLLLVVPSFVLFGLDSYTRNRQKSDVVARVDGQDVTQVEWDAAHKNEVERLRQSMPSLDAKLLDSPQAKYGTLERLVRDRVVAAAAQKLQLSPSDQRLARTLQEDPSIAALRLPDGRLDVERYRQLVGTQGLTPEGFEARVRSELANRQVLAGLTGSVLASQAVADIALNAFGERREVQVARFAASEFGAKLNLSDAEVEQYYKSNPQLFQAPEQADIEYVVLDVDSIKKGITLNEQEVKTYYEQNSARLSGQEERRASHILINAAKGAAQAERDKAKARAEELLAQVKKSPDTFAEVAKKNSQDPGSAVNGGDLDFFARGAMVKPFEEAAFSMKKGDISPVVESEFGYHIIQLTDIKAPKQRSFEELRPELEADLKKQQAQRLFTERADAFTNGVYEQSDALRPVAERLKLELRSVTSVTRIPGVGQTGVLANAKFLNALFSPDSVEKKRNTEAVEVGSNQLVSGRIIKHTPARTLAFADVKERARAQLVAQRGAEMARKEGAEKLAAWKTNPAAAASALGETLTVARDAAGQKLSPALIEAALRANASSLPAWVGVDQGAQGYAVVKVNKVLPRDAATAATTAKDDRQQYAQAWASAESAAYYNLLKERFKAEIKTAKPAISIDRGEQAATQ
jgi:peptidyl-prolyl cis-trans isomerase D